MSSKHLLLLIQSASTMVHTEKKFKRLSIPKAELYPIDEFVNNPNKYDQAYATLCLILPSHQSSTDGSVLFTRRSKLLRSHRGQISLPGGRKEPGDKNLVETA